MKRAIGVMARAPLPGRCKPRLLGAHSPEWAAGLYAAMLRDSLDGLQSVEADDYVVFVAPVPPGGALEEQEDDAETRTRLALDVLARHVPAPWRLVVQPGASLDDRVEHAFGVMFDGGADYALLSRSDAPSVPTEPLTEAFGETTTNASMMVGPSQDGGFYLIGMSRAAPRDLRDLRWGASTPTVMEAARLRCAELGVPLRELPPWYAVDEPRDVLRLLDEMRTAPERAPRTAQFLIKNV